MFRASFLRRINNILSDTYFNANDFDVVPLKKGTGLTITYRFRPEFDFSFEHENDGFLASVSPGSMFIRAERRSPNKTALFESIEEWRDALREELSDEPVNRELLKQRQDIDELIQQFNEQPDEPFNDEETHYIRSRLSEIEEVLTVHRKELAAENEALDQALQSLHQDFETLRGQLETLTKPGWIKSLVVRAAGWLNDPENRKLLKNGTVLVKGLLASEPVDSVTSDTPE